MKLHAAILVAALIVSTPVLAQETPSSLTDEEVKAKAETIEKTLRCVVCQNQSIADSNSTLAEDMRNLVEHRVRLGESEDEVRAYMQARYGDFVLMKPPMKPYTLMLWFLPALLLLSGGVWFALNVRRSGGTTAPEEAELTSAEREKLQKLLNTGEASE